MQTKIHAGDPHLRTVLESSSFAEIAPAVPFWKGYELGTEGETCEHLYIISSGQVLIGRRGDDSPSQALSLLGPGDLFGEGSLLPERRWLVSARAATDGALHMLPAAHLGRLGQFYPQLSTLVHRLLGDRLALTYRCADAMRAASARERVLKLLNTLARNHGRSQGQGIWLDLTVTQLELGEMVGVSRETVARAISDLEAQGCLRHRPRRGFWFPAANGE